MAGSGCSKCAENAKKRAAARAAAMANRKAASNSSGQYAKAVAKGKTTK